MKAFGMEWAWNTPWVTAHPRQWTVTRFKNVATLREERNTGFDDRLLSLSVRRGVQPKEFDDANRVRTGEELANYWQVKPDDLVVNPMWLLEGAVAVSQVEGVISPDYRVYSTVKEVLPSFFHHLLRCDAYVGMYGVLIRGTTTFDRRISKDDFHELPVLVPPPPVQRAIASFLDRKTAAIDALIERKERLVALLQEKRQALVTQAVTKGLDPSVPMKDSGVEWLGEIPAHWRVLRVKHVVELVTSGSRGWSEHFSDEGPLFLQSGNLDRQLGLDLSQVQRVMPPASAEGKRTAVRQNDVLVCITGALTGNVSLVADPIEEAYVNQHVALVRPSSRKVVSGFLAMALASTVGAVQFNHLQYGGTKQGLGLEDVRNTVFACPPIAEQQTIFVELQQALARTRRALALLEGQAKTLAEYRQALITAAVTGKLDLSKEAC